MVKSIRETSGLEDLQVKDGEHNKKVILRGSTEAIAKATAMVEETLAGAAKEAADAVTVTMEIEQEDVPRIIGTRGAVLRDIRTSCGVQANLNNDTLVLELKGLEKNVKDAERMVNEILAGRTTSVEPEVAPAPKKLAITATSKKKPREYKAADDDFPTLGGGPACGTKAKQKWGVAGAKDEGDEKKADSPAEQEEEEEAAGDMDDPFAMMGGMGEEQEFKCTLIPGAD